MAINVFFDITIDNEPQGRIIFELFSNTPITSENFRALCTGEKGIGQKGKPLHYKNNIFHRVIPGFICHGGDFTAENGTGGESIYGLKFNDENFINLHDIPGILSMANFGPNTNGSQFFITLGPCERLNGQYVAFGKVVGGMNVVRAIEEQGDPSGIIEARVVISNCGQL